MTESTTQIAAAVVALAGVIGLVVRWFMAHIDRKDKEHQVTVQRLVQERADERRDFSAERRAFMELVTNHLAHATSAQNAVAASTRDVVATMHTMANEVKELCGLIRRNGKAVKKAPGKRKESKNG